MDAVKGPLYAAVLDCEALVERTVHLFSTRVADVSLAELRRGVCKTTGGTDIGCVAAHMPPRIRRRFPSKSRAAAPAFMPESNDDELAGALVVVNVIADPRQVKAPQTGILRRT